MRATTDEAVGVGTPGVQGVGGDQDAVQVDALQQRLESVDLSGSPVHYVLAEDHPAGIVQGAQQTNSTPVGAAGTAAVFASTARARRRAGEVVEWVTRAGGRVEITVSRSSASMDRRARRIVDSIGAPAPETRAESHHGGQVVDPLGDRGERLRSSQDRADPGGEDRLEPAPDTAGPCAGRRPSPMPATG